MAHSHRSGKLKQQNKKNKRSSASKRSINRRAGGKIQSKKPGGSAAGSKAKADRINEARQRRDLKKKELLASRRGVAVGARGNLGKIADGTSRPRIVGIISLSEEEEGIEERVRDVLVESGDRKVECLSGEVKRSVTVHYAANKKVRFFLTCDVFMYFVCTYLFCFVTILLNPFQTLYLTVITDLRKSHHIDKLILLPPSIHSKRASRPLRRTRCIHSIGIGSMPHL
jgi:hypothetical protein